MNLKCVTIQKWNKNCENAAYMLNVHGRSICTENTCISKYTYRLKVSTWGKGFPNNSYMQVEVPCFSTRHCWMLAQNSNRTLPPGYPDSAWKLVYPAWLTRTPQQSTLHWPQLIDWTCSLLHILKYLTNLVNKQCTLSGTVPRCCRSSAGCCWHVSFWCTISISSPQMVAGASGLLLFWKSTASGSFVLIPFKLQMAPHAPVDILLLLHHTPSCFPDYSIPLQRSNPRTSSDLTQTSIWRQMWKEWAQFKSPTFLNRQERRSIIPSRHSV